VFGREGRVRDEDPLKQVVIRTHVCGVEVLRPLGIKARWFGSEDLIALPVALDPVRSRVLPTDCECEGFDAVPVERLCSQCLKLDPVPEDILLNLVKELLRFVRIFLGFAPFDPIVNCRLRDLMENSETT
jgi:hypothetical protein